MEKIKILMQKRNLSVNIFIFHINMKMIYIINK